MAGLNLAFSYAHNKRRSRHIELLDQARTRLITVFGAMCCAFLLVTLQLGRMSLWRVGEDSALSQHPKTAFYTGRADILDRNGVVLATNVTTTSLFANPKVVQNPKETARKIAKLVPGLKVTSLERRLSDTSKGFVWLARHLSPAQIEQALALGLPGIDFMRDQKRAYPQGALFAHAVGYTDIDGMGMAGLEKGLDRMLRSETPSVITSFDTRLQKILHNSLLEGIKEYQAEGANGTLIDITTGEVLAMVSLPDLNPNQRPKATMKEALFNKNTLGVYEPGSTMKIITTAMALDYGTTNLETAYDTTQPIRVGRFTINDYRPQNYWMNVSEIFIRSSNLGAARMALEVGSKRQKEFFNTLGLLNPMKLEVSEIGFPQIPKYWRDVNTITMAYGYGIAMTPLQLLQATGGILNNGLMHSLTLLKKDGVLSQSDAKQVVASKTSQIVRTLMKKIVERGTARRAGVEGMTVYAKTGTRNLLKRNGEYQKKDVVTQCILFFPEQPKYGLIVMLDRPKRLAKTHHLNAAGWNVAPIAGQIAAHMATALGVQDRSSLPLENMANVQYASLSTKR